MLNAFLSKMCCRVEAWGKSAVLIMPHRLGGAPRPRFDVEATAWDKLAALDEGEYNGITEDRVFGCGAATTCRRSARHDGRTNRESRPPRLLPHTSRGCDDGGVHAD